MFRKIGRLTALLVVSLFLCSFFFHLTLSPYLPYKPFFLFDAYCLPTPSGYVKTSNGPTVFFMKIPAQPWIEVGFPFSKDHPVTCTQGNQSRYGRSHFYTNTFYAVDLASLPGQSAGQIQAVFGGKVFTQSGCEHQGESNVCWCNGGFGNNVRIVQPDGTYALYAHLSSITVRDGEQVKPGDCVGVEGATGAAGHRHLHFSVHKTESSDDLALYQTPGFSIPFTWNIRYQNEPCFTGKSSLEMKEQDAPFSGEGLGDPY